MFFPLLQHSVRRGSRPGTRTISQQVLSPHGLAIQPEAGPSLLSSIPVIARDLTRTRTEGRSKDVVTRGVCCPEMARRKALPASPECEKISAPFVCEQGR